MEVMMWDEMDEADKRVVLDLYDQYDQYDQYGWPSDEEDMSDAYPDEYDGIEEVC